MGCSAALVGLLAQANNEGELLERVELLAPEWQELVLDAVSGAEPRSPKGTPSNIWVVPSDDALRQAIGLPDADRLAELHRWLDASRSHDPPGRPAHRGRERPRVQRSRSPKSGEIPPINPTHASRPPPAITALGQSDTSRAPGEKVEIRAQDHDDQRGHGRRTGHRMPRWTVIRPYRPITARPHPRSHQTSRKSPAFVDQPDTHIQDRNR